MAKIKKPDNPGAPGRVQKKLKFEDGVRSALVAGVVICAVVLAGAGFFAVRSLLGGDFDPPAREAAFDPGSVSESGDSFEDTPWTQEDRENSDGFDADGAASENIPDILPELEDAIRRLEAESPDRIAAAPDPSVHPVRPQTELPPVFPPERRGILVVVIDDAGNNLRELDPFLAFPGPLTIAVLPGLANSAEAARRVRAAKKELFLHQPMEPLGGQNPGPGAITTGMTAQEIMRIVNRNLDEIWPVRGMNNHEGSKATMDAALIKTVLEICRTRNICFLDSRTISDTAVPAVARNMNFPIAGRDVFLDNEQDRDSILAALETGCMRAERNGLAIMIGHAWSPQLAGILAEKYPALVKKGFYFATVSAVLDAGK